jgi:hypothetical protein
MRKPYPSDLTDVQWEVIKGQVPPDPDQLKDDTVASAT